MGIIDSMTFTLVCRECGTSESIQAVDRGSIWSGSHWSGLSSAARFDVTSVGGALVAPTVTSATCKSCGLPARIE